MFWVAAADRHARLACPGAKPVEQPVIAFESAARIDHRGAGAGLDGGGELRLEAMVGDDQDGEIDRLGKIADGGVTRQVLDPLVVRVDGVERPGETAAPDFMDDGVAGKAASIRGADNRDRARREQGAKAMGGGHRRRLSRR